MTSFFKRDILKDIKNTGSKSQNNDKILKEEDKQSDETDYTFYFDNDSFNECIKFFEFISNELNSLLKFILDIETDDTTVVANKIAEKLNTVNKNIVNNESLKNYTKDKITISIDKDSNVLKNFVNIVDRILNDTVMFKVGNITNQEDKISKLAKLYGKSNQYFNDIIMNLHNKLSGLDVHNKYVNNTNVNSANRVIVNMINSLGKVNSIIKVVGGKAEINSDDEEVRNIINYINKFNVAMRKFGIKFNELTHRNNESIRKIIESKLNRNLIPDYDRVVNELLKNLYVAIDMFNKIITNDLSKFDVNKEDINNRLTKQNVVNRLHKAVIAATIKTEKHITGYYDRIENILIRDDSIKPIMDSFNYQTYINEKPDRFIEFFCRYLHNELYKLCDSSDDKAKADEIYERIYSVLSIAENAKVFMEKVISTFYNTKYKEDVSNMVVSEIDKASGGFKKYESAFDKIEGRNINEVTDEAKKQLLDSFKNDIDNISNIINIIEKNIKGLHIGNINLLNSIKNTFKLTKSIFKKYLTTDILSDLEFKEVSPDDKIELNYLIDTLRERESSLNKSIKNKDVLHIKMLDSDKNVVYLFKIKVDKNISNVDGLIESIKSNNIVSRAIISKESYEKLVAYNKYLSEIIGELGDCIKGLKSAENEFYDKIAKFIKYVVYSLRFNIDIGEKKWLL